MLSNEKILPLGQSDFRALRKSNAVYIDKTLLIHDLARVPGCVFLSRPRRFGKSLLASTFESLFKYGVRDFKALSIERLWTDKTYDVVRLDFSNIKQFTGIEDFAHQFRHLLSAKFSEVGFESKGTAEDLAELGHWLAQLEALSLVLLIDELDAPLAACLDKPELFELILLEMQKFFLSLKTNVGCLRFLFAAGITKFGFTNVFCDQHNDISLSPAYGALLGFTEEEIRQNFGPFLTKAAEALAMSENELLARLHARYGGFCFDGSGATRLYCPWSVLNFLKAPEQGLLSYWFASGGHPSVLMKHLEGCELGKPTGFSAAKLVRMEDLAAPKEIPGIGRDILLTQVGCLTIKAVDELGVVSLGYPNQEVAISMAQLYADQLLSGRVYRPHDGVLLESLLAKGQISAIVDRFNEVLNALDYNRYPIVDEATCRAYLQVLMIGADMVPQVEVHTSQGTSALEVDAGHRHWVFELKFAEKTSQANQLLIKAAAQMQNRRYGRTPQDKKLICAALVFSAEARRFVAWQQVQAEA